MDPPALDSAGRTCAGADRRRQESPSAAIQQRQESRDVTSAGQIFHGQRVDVGCVGADRSRDLASSTTQSLDYPTDVTYRPQICRSGSVTSHSRFFDRLITPSSASCSRIPSRTTLISDHSPSRWFTVKLIAIWAQSRWPMARGWRDSRGTVGVGQKQVGRALPDGLNTRHRRRSSRIIREGAGGG
jgi:hypothetical protein